MLPLPLKFWGQNTYLPLDVAFISDDNVITKIAHISPLSNKVVMCEKDCKIAIETNHGYFDKNNINIGDKIEIFNYKDGLVNIGFCSKCN